MPFTLRQIIKVYLIIVWKLFKEENWELTCVDYDYHKKEGAMDFPTEYENKFRKKGQPIFRFRRDTNLSKKHREVILCVFFIIPL